MLGVNSPELPRTRATSRGPFSIGEVIADTYRIDAELGIGGMGAVYEATDLSLPRRVAIKAPLWPIHAAALRIEAQALAAVRHPSFVTVYCTGKHEGTDFFVMERLYGETLQARLDALRMEDKQLSIADALDILVAITDGLAAAHRVGIAHRDLKPSNVILSGDRAVLFDLGLFVPDVLDDRRSPAGSPYWMAPEVLMSSVERGNGSFVDLYALGVIAFELLTGRLPFTGDSIGNVLVRHLAGEIPNPSDLRPEIALPLAGVVMQLLAKEPTDRPPGAESVLWQLHELRGRAVIAPTTVLVVDDDIHCLTAIRRALVQSFPHLDVRCTTDGAQALPDDCRAPADIVVLDIDMPRVNGVEICMALRSLPVGQRPRILAMSGSARPQDIAVLRSLGVSRYFPKDDRLIAGIGAEISRARCGGAQSVRPLPVHAVQDRVGGGET